MFSSFKLYVLEYYKKKNITEKVRLVALHGLATINPPTGYLYTILIAFPARNASNVHRHRSLRLTATQAGASARPNSPRPLFLTQLQRLAPPAAPRPPPRPPSARVDTCRRRECRRPEGLRLAQAESEGRWRAVGVGEGGASTRAGGDSRSECRRPEGLWPLVDSAAVESGTGAWTALPANRPSDGGGGFSGGGGWRRRRRARRHRRQRAHWSAFSMVGGSGVDNCGC
jgi:hypothetical protein